MNLQQHPLSASFPAMNAEQIEARLDGVIPMTATEVTVVIASAWFQSLKQSQRAMYVCGWFHQLALGSNQHKQIVRADTPRYAAEATQSVLSKAAA